MGQCHQGGEWLEVSVATSAEAEDAVSEMLMRAGAKGVVIEDPRLAARLVEQLGPSMVNEPDAVAAWRQYMASDLPEAATAGGSEVIVVKGYLSPQTQPDQLASLAREVRRLPLVGLNPGPALVSSALVQEEDWANSWKKYYTTIRAGRRLVIVPSWLSHEALADDIVITLDPGMAFGTGTHPTTQLCLAALEDVVTPGAKVLDVGTGSGILAIAAAKLGGDVLAMDIDTLAVSVATENVRRNGVDGAVRVCCGTLDSIPRKCGYDIIVANIVTETILSILPAIPDHLNPQGCFLASGIVSDRIAEVHEAWQVAGLSVSEVKTSGEWACIRGGLRPEDKR